MHYFEKNTIMQIIPAIDLIDGKCVRLTQGDYTRKKIYNENPVEVAKMFEDAGIKRLHLVDLDGAKAGEVINWKVLEKIVASTNLQIDFGGGIKKQQDVEKILNAGALFVTIGSVAVKNESLLTHWIEVFGTEKFFLGADVKDEKMAISGWQETTDIDIFSFLKKYTEKGLHYVFCTDVSKDGMLAGPSLDLYKNILTAFPSITLVASGGVSTMSDLEGLKSLGCKAAIVGKALYEGKVSLQDLKDLY